MITTKIKVGSKANTIINATCSQCHGETKHTILTDVDLYGNDEQHEVDVFNWNENYQIIRCNGCETFSFRKASTNSEDITHYETPNGYEAAYYVTEEYFPSRKFVRSSIRQEDYHLLPIRLSGLYDETLHSLNSEQRVLAGIGVRALVEAVCKDNEAKGKDLKEKINFLFEQRKLTIKGAEILQKLRVMGNEAAHDVEPHKIDTLSTALDVIDHLLKEVYILPHYAEKKLKSSK